MRSSRSSSAAKGPILAAAEALYVRGAFTEMVALLAVVATPDQPNATVFRLLGLAQLGLGAVADCLATIAADARLSLASGLLEEDRHEEALALLENERPSDPALATPWQLQHALALVSNGDTARAGATLDAIGRPPPIYAPMLSWRRVIVAEAEGDIAAARAHARETENALRRSGQDMLPENRIMAHFDLAKFWSQYDERERAFAFWVSGHALLRQIQPFSRASFRAFVNASITSFPRAAAQRADRIQW